MWLQLLIAAVFIAMVISLAMGAGFLLRDPGSSRRLLNSLKWRIGLACLLMALIIFGFWSGQLG
ncbi:twin transmembrane helix small protein [Vreelandella sp. H-I2]